MSFDTRSKSAVAGRSAGQFELQTWFFMRVSGLLLIFLALGHVFIMTVINDLETIDYAFVAARWAMPIWRVYDGLLLTLGILHGANGLRWVIDDYVRHPGWRVLAQSVLYTVTFIIFVMGSIILVVFRPVE